MLAVASHLLFSHWAQQPVTATARAGQVAGLVKQQILQTASGVLRYVVPGLCLFAAVLSCFKRQVRIPLDPGRRSALMADSIPQRWRTLFQAEGGQRSSLIADTGKVS